MKKLSLLAILVISYSCAQLEEVYNQHKTPEPIDNSKELAEAQARKEMIIEKMSLSNTINLKIGQSDSDVKKIMLKPDSVSATENETVWHYNLYENYIEGELNRMLPFRITFKKDRIVKFGIDQDQVERNKAQVIIQKDQTPKGNE